VSKLLSSCYYSACVHCSAISDHDSSLCKNTGKYEQRHMIMWRYRMYAVPD